MFSRVAVLMVAAGTAAAVLEKTHFEDDVRFLFVAGLEGTGHHTVGTVLSRAPFHDVVNASRELRNSLHPGCKTNPYGINVMGDEVGNIRTVKDIKHNEEMDTIVEAGLQLQQRQRQFRKDMAEARRRVGADKLVLLNGFEDRGMQGSSQISYPNCGRAHKPQHHPDLVDIASAAEDAGVDLRVLVLTRSAREILTSTVMHRNFADAAYSAAYLADNAAALATQLRLVDRRFYKCSDQASLLQVTTDETAHAALWGDLGAFLHPALLVDDLVDVTARLGEKMHLRSLQQQMGGDRTTAGANAFVEHLARYVAVIDEICAN